MAPSNFPKSISSHQALPRQPLPAHPEGSDTHFPLGAELPRVVSGLELSHVAMHLLGTHQVVDALASA